MPYCPADGRVMLHPVPHPSVGSDPIGGWRRMGYKQDRFNHCVITRTIETVTTATFLPILHCNRVSVSPPPPSKPIPGFFCLADMAGDQKDSPIPT